MVKNTSLLPKATRNATMYRTPHQSPIGSEMPMGDSFSSRRSLIPFRRIYPHKPAFSRKRRVFCADFPKSVLTKGQKSVTMTSIGYHKAVKRRVSEALPFRESRLLRRDTVRSAEDGLGAAQATGSLRRVRPLSRRSIFTPQGSFREAAVNQGGNTVISVLVPMRVQGLFSLRRVLFGTHYRNQGTVQNLRLR